MSGCWKSWDDNTPVAGAGCWVKWLMFFIGCAPQTELWLRSWCVSVVNRVGRLNTSNEASNCPPTRGRWPDNADIMFTAAQTLYKQSSGETQIKNNVCPPLNSDTWNTSWALVSPACCYTCPLCWLCVHMTCHLPPGESDWWMDMKGKGSLSLSLSFWVFTWEILFHFHRNVPCWCMFMSVLLVSCSGVRYVILQLKWQWTVCLWWI